MTRSADAPSPGGPRTLTRRVVIGAAVSAVLTSCASDTTAPVAPATFVPPRGMVTVPLPGARPGQTLDTWRRDLEVVRRHGCRLVRAPMSSYVGATADGSHRLDFSGGVLTDTLKALEMARAAKVSIMIATPGHPGGGLSESGTAYADRVHGYVQALALRLKDLVDAWQLFNEPDQADFRSYFRVPLIEQYAVDLKLALDAGRQGLHGALPGVPLTTSLGGYPCNDKVEKTWRFFLDIVGESVDAVGLDCYCGTDLSLTDALGGRVRRIKEAYRKPVWIIETGLPVTGPAAQGPTQLVHGRAHIQALRAGGADVIGWYDLRDPVGRATETGYGLLRADWTPKPGLEGLMKEIV